MGARNYLVDGVSGSGKTSVAEELQRRGRHVIHGDRELAYHGDPATGEPRGGPSGETGEAATAWRHRHWIWNVETVRSLVADHAHPETFFCGGSRNHSYFIDLFNKVFVLEADLDCLKARVALRADDEFGGKPDEWAMLAQLHATREDLPQVAVSVDAARPISTVVDDILSRCGTST